MSMEYPYFKRCCFCLPLRYGLLIWAYIKLLATLAVFAVLVAGIAIRYYRGLVDVETYTIIAVLLLIIIIDIAFVIMFIVGGHKKSHKLTRIYYYYLLVQLTLNLILLLINFGIDTFMFGWSGFLQMIMYDGIVMAFYLTLNAYILFLVRSAMVKFRDNCKFEFVNNAAESEAQCNLNVQ